MTNDPPDDPWAPWSLAAAVYKRLNLTPEQQVEFRKRYIQWDESLKPFAKALRDSERITAKDLMITVTNPDKW